MSSLNLSDDLPRMAIPTYTPELQLAKAKQVRTMGIVSLFLLLTGFIPLFGLFGLLAAMLISKKASKMALEYMVPESYEKPAKWAWTISTVFLILGVLGLALMIMR